MSKYKKIGGFLFRTTKGGLKMVSKGAKTGYHKYKRYKAGEAKRLKQQRDKEQLKSQIRRYKSQYKPKGNGWKSVEKFFSPSKKRRR